MSLKVTRKLSTKESPSGGAYQIQEEGCAGRSAGLWRIDPDPKNVSVAELHRLVSTVAPTLIDMDIPCQRNFDLGLKGLLGMGDSLTTSHPPCG